MLQFGVCVKFSQNSDVAAERCCSWLFLITPCRDTLERRNFWPGSRPHLYLYDVFLFVQNFGLDYDAFQHMVGDCPPDFLQLAFNCCNVSILLERERPKLESSKSSWLLKTELKVFTEET